MFAIQERWTQAGGSPPADHVASTAPGRKDSNQSTRTIYIPCFPANMDLSAFFEKHCGAVARTKVAVTACAYGFVEFHATDAVEKVPPIKYRHYRWHRVLVLGGGTGCRARCVTGLFLHLLQKIKNEKCKQ